MHIQFHSKVLIICFLHLTLLGVEVKAQAGDTTIFAPLGATWSYNPETWGPPWFSNPLFAYFLVERDTTILGYQARAIGFYVNEENQLVRIDSLTKYVSTLGNKVFYKVGDEFVLLYDFGAQIGDTIHSKVEDFPYSLGCVSGFSEGVIEFSYVVDSIGTTIIDGEELRMLYVHTLDNFPDPNWHFWEPIVERLGYAGWGGFWWGQGGGCILETGYLRCYVDQDIMWRSNYFNNGLPCDYTDVSEIPISSQLNISPNPSKSFVCVPDDARNIAVFNFTGQRLKVDIENSKLDVSRISSGIYLIICEINRKLRTSTFLKVE